MDTSFSRSLCLALGLHAGIVGVGRWVAGPPSRARPPESISYEVSVVVEPSRTLEAPESAAEVGGAPPGAARSSAGARAVVRGASESGPVGGSVEGSEGQGAVTEVAPSGPAASATPRAVDLGLGGLWARPGLPDRPKGGWRSGAEAAGGLGQGLEARDQERGLGRGGVVATLARSAAISVGPSEGEASFTVQTDREGRIASVTLGDARGGPSWNDVSTALRRALASKRLRVPPGSNGLSVQIWVRAKVQLPSGARPGQAVSAQGAGAEFDVADVGARPTRVVSARVTSERLL